MWDREVFDTNRVDPEDVGGMFFRNLGIYVQMQTGKANIDVKGCVYVSAERISSLEKHF